MPIPIRARMTFIFDLQRLTQMQTREREYSNMFGFELWWTAIFGAHCEFSILLYKTMLRNLFLPAKLIIKSVDGMFWTNQLSSHSIQGISNQSFWGPTLKERYSFVFCHWTLKNSSKKVIIVHSVAVIRFLCPNCIHSVCARVCACSSTCSSAEKQKNNDNFAFSHKLGYNRATIDNFTS